MSDQGDRKREAALFELLRRSPVRRSRPKDWDAPRGNKIQVVHGGRSTAQWQWDLQSVLDADDGKDFACEFEKQVVSGLAGCVKVLVEARQAKEWSLRRLSWETKGWPNPEVAAAAGHGNGVNISVLTGLEKGSAWPRFETVAVVAGTLGHRLIAVDTTTGRPVVEQTKGRDAARSRGSNCDQPHWQWQADVAAEVRSRLKSAGLAMVTAAAVLDLEPNTITEFGQPHSRAARVLPTGNRAPGHWASWRTIGAVTTLVGLRVTAAPNQ